MKNILIIGEHSYIGDSIGGWLEKHKDVYKVSYVSSKNNAWEEADFGQFHTVIDVAGICHCKINSSIEPLMYEINRDLAIKLCEKAKREKTEQFIYLSSMNVYGDTNKQIKTSTIPDPKHFYGKSKLEADNAIQKMNTESFKVVSIRPPVVYGKGCKGNFELLEKGAKWIPLFPALDNHRSILFIYNLCEFVRLCIDDNVSGVYHPQNREWVSTADIVKALSRRAGHRVIFTKWFNKCIQLLIPRIRILQRIFDDDWYCKEISNTFDFNYCVYSFKESVKQL